MTFDHVGVAFLDRGGQLLQRRMLGLLRRTGINHDQLFPSGVVRKRDACQVSLRCLGQVSFAGRTEHVELHPLHPLEGQLLEKRPPGRG